MPLMRTLQREVHLVAQAQYEQRGDKLYLTRWRLISDGEPHDWQPASGTDNGGWSRELNTAEVDLVGNGATI